MNDERPREEIGFFSDDGTEKKVDAVLDTRSSFSIVANRLIETSNPKSPSPPTFIEDSLGNRYKRIGTVKLTWFRPSRATTFVVEFAVVEEDIDIMILGNQACQDAEIRRELQLLPFGLAPTATRSKEQEEELHKKREEQARARGALERERRNREQQAAHGGPRQTQL